MSRPLIWLLQAAIFAVAVVAAFLMRFDLSLPSKERTHLVYALSVWVVVKIIVFWLAKLDRGWWTFTSLHDLTRLARGNLIGSLLGTCAILWIAPRGFPRSVYVLDLLVCLLLTAAVRLAARIFFEASKPPASADTNRALIYGAGHAGSSLLVEMRHNRSLPYNVVGFIDDDPKKAEIVIQGTNILGNGQKLAAVVAKHNVDTILIAIPSASGQQMTQILRRCQESGVLYKTVPGLGEVIQGNGLAKQIRDVSVEDLLGRSPAQLDEEDIAGKLNGKVIVVTGAGGSIGSELCRQIARFRPEAIVGYEISENALFHLDLEMKMHSPQVRFYPEIGSVQKPQRLTEVLARYHPSVLRDGPRGRRPRSRRFCNDFDRQGGSPHEHHGRVKASRGTRGEFVTERRDPLCVRSLRQCVGE
jgi:FlaA1/EpsC-like NDP-sugar epimerase